MEQVKLNKRKMFGSSFEQLDQVEIHCSLQMKPAEFWVREARYPTYACKNCEK